MSDADLEAFRNVMDPEADQLAAIVIGKPGPSGASPRIGYNLLVDIADHLIFNTPLLMRTESGLRQNLATYDQEFQDYYSPMPAPAWVDTKKIEIASGLWRDNTVAMLGILYGASLPACYLIKNGIPLLYETAKLREPRFVTQRIYETGLMLDAVLSPGGLRVMQDVDSEKEFITRLKLDPNSKIPPSEEILAKIVNLPGSAGKRSYLWGNGYVTAKKVRMLHATMRCMVLRPGNTARPPAAPSMEGVAVASVMDGLAKAGPWPTETLGAPINQEDLAWTLLTFSYLIPRGMERIGCSLTMEEKEAFLHIWRVVGHIMGIRDELMTDNWEEAEKLYNRIHRLQTGSSPSGIALTQAVMGFLRGYLPAVFGFRRMLPIVLIAQQIGRKDTAALLDESDQRILNSLHCRMTVFALTLVLHFFFLVQSVLRILPPARALFDGMFLRASESIVQSWRDGYARRPYWIPASKDTWVQQTGVDDAYRSILQNWRQRLFNGLVVAVSAAMAFSFGMAAAGLFLAYHHFDGMWWSAGISAGCALLSISVLTWYVPFVFARRPEPVRVHAPGA